MPSHELPPHRPCGLRRRASPQGIPRRWFSAGHQIENLAPPPATEEFHQNVEGLLPLLLGGLQNGGEHGLRPRTSFRAVATPVLARPDQGADGSLTLLVASSPGQ
jgi:hypothetical protein